MNSELERKQNEVFVAAFKALSRNLPGGPQVSHRNRDQDGLHPGRDSKRESPAYKSKSSPLELNCLVQKRYGNGKFIAVYKIAWQWTLF
jgi:hypothetical protein